MIEWWNVKCFNLSALLSINLHTFCSSSNLILESFKPKDVKLGNKDKKSSAHELSSSPGTKPFNEMDSILDSFLSRISFVSLVISSNAMLNASPGTCSSLRFSVFRTMSNRSIHFNYIHMKKKEMILLLIKMLNWSIAKLGQHEWGHINRLEWRGS